MQAAMNTPRVALVFGLLVNAPLAFGQSVPSAPPAAAPARAASPAPAPAPASTTPAMPAAPTTPAAPTSFDELVKEALPAKDLHTLIEPLYARCDEGDDLRRRQCEGTRAFLLDHLRGHTFVADADVQPDTTPYDAVAKQVDMEVPGCLACVAPPRVAGEPRYLVTRPPQRVVNGRAQVVPVANHEIPLDDRVKADRFVERVVPRLRVQHVFKFGATFGDAATTSSTPAAPVKGAPPAIGPAAKGVLIASMGHRVYDRCTGEIAASTVPSTGKVAVKPDRTCPRKGTDELSQAEMRRAAEIAALPERLTPRQIDSVLAPVQARMHECYVEFGEPSGTAKLQVTITGEGRLTNIALPAPFDKADIGLCMRAQLKATSFPKFRGGSMTVDYVYQVN
jgi:hypothetical protein